MSSTTAQSQPQWSHSLLFPDRVTPLTWSITGPSAERALRTTFASLGVQIPSQTTLWRRDAGQVLVNQPVIDAACQDAFASNSGAPALGRQLMGRGQDRYQAAVLRQVLQAVPQQLATIERWWERIQAMEWRQATVLQIMEEIEPSMEVALTTHYQVATSVSGLQQQLSQWLDSWIPGRVGALSVPLFAGLSDDFATVGYRHQVHQLSAQAHEEAKHLSVDSMDNWQQSLPHGAFRRELESFLTSYGRYGPVPLETASPRWQEAPAMLLHTLISDTSAVDAESPQQSRQRRADAAAQVSRELGLLRRRTFEPAFQQLEALADLLPTCRDGLVTVVAAARYWAMGAAREAVHDGRLARVQQVFLLELEELKQMMTGEWSQADRVQTLVATRLAEQEHSQLNHS